MSASPTSKIWTTRTLLAWMNSAFAEKGLDSPRLSAEMLLSHVLGCDRLRLYMDQDRPASPLERSALRDLVARALKHEPIQYLIGKAWFFGLEFEVDARVLIPRPCTETIVERVLQHAQSRPGFGAGEGDTVLIADVCTGSGCIAAALARNLPHARVLATDISEDALAVASNNIANLGLDDRVDLRAGNLLEPVLGHPAAGQEGSLCYLVSNPPYIPDHQWDSSMGENVRGHEPELALRGGADGLDLIRPLIDQAPVLIRPGGLLLVEIASTQAEEAMLIARSHDLLEAVEIVADLEGNPRTLVAVRNSVKKSL